MMPDVLLQALSATLDHFDCGVVVVFPDGKIIHANRMAHDMMQKAWPIRAHDGSLLGCGEKATARLMQGVRHVSEDIASGLPDDRCYDLCLAESAPPKAAAIVTLKRLSCSTLQPAPVAVIVTIVEKRSDYPLSAMIECFGLTSAETRTLENIVKNGTVAAVACAMALSANTVKTHLHNIYWKTRASSKTDLVKLVNDLRPPLRFYQSDGAQNPRPPHSPS